MDIATIGVGAIGGLGWAVLGYAKQKTSEDGAEFSAQKLIKTLIIGAIVGSAVAYSGTAVSTETIELFVAESSMMGVVTAGVSKFVGLAWNLIKKGI